MTNIEPHDPVTAAIELLKLLDRWQRLEVLRYFAAELAAADFLSGGGMASGAMVLPEPVRPTPSRFLP